MRCAGISPLMFLDRSVGSKMAQIPHTLPKQFPRVCNHSKVKEEWNEVAGYSVTAFSHDYGSTLLVYGLLASYTYTNSNYYFTDWMPLRTP